MIFYLSSDTKINENVVQTIMIFSEKTFNMTLPIKKEKRPAIYILKLITIENDVREDIIYKKVF